MIRRGLWDVFQDYASGGRILWAEKSGRFWLPSAVSNGGGGLFFTAFRRLVAVRADSCLWLRPSPRHQAGVRQLAKHLFLCGPATAPAPSSAIRRTGFSLGEGLAKLFRLISPVMKYSKPARRFREAAGSALGARIKARGKGLSGRCPLPVS